MGEAVAGREPDSLGTPARRAALHGLPVGLGALAGVLCLRALLHEEFVPASAALIAPLAIASFASAAATAIVGGAAVATSAVLLVLEDLSWTARLIRLAIAAFSTAIAVVLADRREQREAELDAHRRDEAKAAQRRAARSARLLTTVADDIDDPIFVKDTEGRYLFANRSAALILGGTPDTVTGRTDAELLDPENARLFRDHDLLVMATGDSVEFEEAGTWTGRARVLLVTKAPYRDADGSIIGVIGVGRDVTERLRTERRTAVIQDVIAHLATALTIDEVVAAILDAASPAVGAVASAVALVDSDREGAQVIGARGVPETIVERWSAMVADTSNLMARAAFSGEVATLDDSEDLHDSLPDVAKIMAAVGARSGIWLPVRGGGGVLGAMGFAFAEPHAVGDVDLELLDSVARRCGQAIERASLFEAEARERRRAEMVSARETSLSELTRTMSATDDVEDLVATILDTGLPLLGAPDGALYEFDAERDRLVLAAARSRAGWTLPEHLPVDHDSALARVVRTGTPLFLEGSLEMSAFCHDECEPAGDQSWSILPISAYGIVRGVLGLRFPGGRLVDDDERSFLIDVGERCGEAFERARLHVAERRARQEAQRRAAALSDLQRVTTALARALTAADVAATLLDAVVWRVDAHAAAVMLPEQGGASLRVLDHRGNSALEPGTTVRAISAGMPRGTRPLELFDRASLRTQGGGVGGVFADAGYEAAAIYSLRGRSRAGGVLVLAWREPPALDSATAQYVATLVAVAGQSLERAASFDEEHAIADTVQRSLLPTLPEALGDVALVGRFQPGSRHVQVGGDWFDAFQLPGGRVALCVGDVEGRGIAAATCMGQVRAALHALATSSDNPGTLVARLRASPDLAQGPMVTLALVVVDRDRLRYLHAGHPPLLVRYPDGQVVELDEARSVPLGVGLSANDCPAVADVPPGSLLVMYTDGLIERRGETLDEGLARLRAALVDGPDELDHLADHLLHRCVEKAGEDDVCLLIARL